MRVLGWCYKKLKWIPLAYSNHSSHMPPRLTTISGSLIGFACVLSCPVCLSFWPEVQYSCSFDCFPFFSPWFVWIQPNRLTNELIGILAVETSVWRLPKPHERRDISPSVYLENSVRRLNKWKSEQNWTCLECATNLDLFFFVLAAGFVNLLGILFCDLVKFCSHFLFRLIGSIVARIMVCIHNHVIRTCRQMWTSLNVLVIGVRVHSLSWQC